MRALEVAASIQPITTYLRALWNYMLYPNARTLPTWCRAPKQCKLKHKLVIIQPPNKPARLGFKHIEV